MAAQKRIALFLDGTWNSVQNNTNVWRAKSLCATSGDQISYYSQGVGTLFGQRFMGGAFGYGLDAEVINAYEWLVENYSQGDQIFIFGFSRGAYTARALSGLISECGRAERMYGGERDTFRRRLFPRATAFPGDATPLDTLSARELCEMGRIIGVRPKGLFSHRLADGPRLLKSSERRAYCPLCWAEDQNAGRPPAHRRAWAGIFSLRCLTHDAPLRWSSPHMNIDAAVTVQTRPQTVAGDRILRFIESFAEQMDHALYAGSAWPCGWRGDAGSARALLMRCTVNLGCMVEHPPFGSISAPPDLNDFVRPPVRRIEPLGGSPWEHVRSLGPPAWRRAALWMVARYVIPTPKPGLLPEVLPIDVFSGLERQWEGVPSGFRMLRRTRRYRDALSAMCRAFSI